MNILAANNASVWSMIQQTIPLVHASKEMKVYILVCYLYRSVKARLDLHILMMLSKNLMMRLIRFAMYTERILLVTVGAFFLGGKDYEWTEWLL